MPHAERATLKNLHTPAHSSTFFSFCSLSHHTSSQAVESGDLSFSSKAQSIEQILFDLYRQHPSTWVKKSFSKYPSERKAFWSRSRCGLSSTRTRLTILIASTSSSLATSTLAKVPPPAVRPLPNPAPNDPTIITRRARFPRGTRSFAKQVNRLDLQMRWYRQKNNREVREGKAFFTVFDPSLHTHTHTHWLFESYPAFPYHPTIAKKSALSDTRHRKPPSWAKAPSSTHGCSTN